MAGPERSCLACGEKGDKSSFVRFALDPDGGVGVDAKHKLPGRGAYICPKKECLETVAKKNLFSRAYKRKMPPIAADELKSRVADAYTRYLLSLMRAANGARKLSGGHASVEDAVLKERAKLILIAADAGNDIKDKAEEFSKRVGSELIEILADKREIAEILGFSVKSIFSINDTGLALIMQTAGRLAVSVKR